MPGRVYDNIFLEGYNSTVGYTSKKKGRSKGIPTRDVATHGNRIKTKLAQLWEDNNSNIVQREAVALPVKGGMYLEFISEPGYDLVTKSLENMNYDIRLMNVREEKLENDQLIQKATVFIPKGKENYFLSKVDEYINDTTDKGKPKNERLIATISNIQNAVVESFWIGKNQWMPLDEPNWCEVWLNSEIEEVKESLFNILNELVVEYRNESIVFPERRVIVCKVTKANLQELIIRSNSIAEFRRSSETSSFFVELENAEQVEWAKELLDRTTINNEQNIHIGILDTGVNNGHMLLRSLLLEEDMKSYDQDWGTDDHQGHGTLMSGLCAYGNIKKALEVTTDVTIKHGLESYKILPRTGENQPHLYGAITTDSVSDLIIENPDRKRIYCMAVSAPKYESVDGSPSSWSASIDSLVSGAYDEIRKLFFVSAGNMDRDDWPDYPISNSLSSVQSPGQSWNALTVGAYTSLSSLNPDIYGAATTLASSGQLSPFSTTSSIWDKKWPIKPEILFEGGNVLKDEYGCFACDDLSLLSIAYDIQRSQFASFNATSAATAQAAWMAANIMDKYPNIWPETIRALMIHSASWTDQMKEQFLEDHSKGSYGVLLRHCGYGVPELESAISCASNSVNMIIEAELQPFDKAGSNYVTKDMHIYELPWPKEVLEELFDAEVEMKITLSYFVEPGPGEIGWKDRYRYASSVLRFDVNGSDTQEMFESRINKAAQDEYDDIPDSGGPVKWLLGPNNRNVGSIHSDTWKGTAAQLASSNLIGVYPAIGWWRERKQLGKWSKKIRYSLVVSLSTPISAVDLYTPIINKINVKVPVEITL